MAKAGTTHSTTRGQGVAESVSLAGAEEAHMTTKMGITLAVLALATTVTGVR
jgi:hypothetical protein